ncbi:hypothetical protein HP456_00110 [Bacillus haikouensis]|uniref:hypothetical protein n=1 Tax=Bacillus haikouensis TaxID=1510468 RepID=UPI0015569133|nr:hypothetical protein [Bacillus haikouensis]NQD64325.1 hypothetical protein [Bacillus haikouensis]
METKNALTIRKFIPKKRIAKVEMVIIEYGNIVEQFEKGLIDLEDARKLTTRLFKEAITKNIISPSNVDEIMQVDKDTIEYLKEKHGVQ